MRIYNIQFEMSPVRKHVYSIDNKSSDLRLLNVCKMMLFYMLEPHEAVELSLSFSVRYTWSFRFRSGDAIARGWHVSFVHGHFFRGKSDSYV